MSVVCFNENYKHTASFLLLLILSFMVTVMFVFHYDLHHCVGMVFIFMNCSETHFVGRIQEVGTIYAHVQCYATSCLFMIT
jgi:hypothetical protein